MGNTIASVVRHGASKSEANPPASLRLYTLGTLMRQLNCNVESC
jgi:hypothetical protein